jgi:ubiquinone/menaquinone biosynthesis C-methylase UbiE
LTPGLQESHSEEPLEDADISTSSDDYARRFAGPVGQWFVDTQARITLDLLRILPAGTSVLDVGGGHAQVALPLINAGYDVTVVGSDASCGGRLRPLIDRGRCRFDVGDLRSLPYADRSFDAVVCFRLLSHSVSWTRLVAELCRVARHSVVLDYPSLRSANILSERLFSLKKGIELNTRQFLMFTPKQIRAAFAENGFRVGSERPQFLVPMVLHRLANSARLSRVAEAPGRALGLTRWFGSPVVVRADRCVPGS